MEEMRGFFKNMVAKTDTLFDEEKFMRNWNKMDTNSDNRIDFAELFRFMHSKAVADGQMSE